MIATRDNVKKALENKFKITKVVTRDKAGKKVVQKDQGFYVLSTKKYSKDDSKKIDNAVDSVNWFLKELGARVNMQNVAVFAGGTKGNFSVQTVVDWYENADDQSEEYYLRFLYK